METQVQVPVQNTRPKVRPWRDLAFFASMVMELSWVALWSQLLLRRGSDAGYLQFLIVFGGIQLGAYLVAWVGERWELRLVYQRILMTLVILLSILIALETLLVEYGGWTLREVLSRPLRTFADMSNFIPIEFVLALILLGLVWRGVYLVDQHIEPVLIVSGFRTGVIMFFIYGFMVPFSDTAPVVALVLFLFSSLLAMSAARIAVLSHLRGGQSLAFDRSWLGGILTAISAMVALAVLVAIFMRGAGFNILTRIVTGLVYLLAIILSPLLWLVMQLVFWLGEWLNFTEIFLSITKIFQKLQQFVEALINTITHWARSLNTADLERFVSYLALSRPLLLWGTILFFLLIILLTMRRHLWKRGEPDDASEMESLLNQKNLFDLLKDALRRGLGKMRDELEKLSGLRNARRMLAAARIRRIYARLMDLSARLNTPRPEARTPLEFLVNLDEVFPAEREDLRTITHAYLRIRYGDLPETHDEVRLVETAWLRVAADGREQLKARRRASVDSRFAR